MSQAEQITKSSKSNLAFAFISLPRERRHDITAFYAFCRRVDDTADDPGISVAERRKWLHGWRTWIYKPGPGEPRFADEVRQIIEKYQIDRKLFEDILDGVEMDLEPVRFHTFAELSTYCYRVASAVGLVSIEIFGYQNAQCHDYAYNLGLALQLTNIIRDVDTDLRNGGRIYIPLDEIARFGYSEASLLARVYNDSFVNLMKYQADRARLFYREARRFLPNEDRRSMVAAEGMRAIYCEILRRIEADQFRVFGRNYRLSGLKKAVIIFGQIASNVFA
ncbi:MAG: squalene/phytoene synthase family protein [Chthoniobacterales bacterium]